MKINPHSLEIFKEKCRTQISRGQWPDLAVLLQDVGLGLDSPAAIDHIVWFQKITAQEYLRPLLLNPNLREIILGTNKDLFIDPYLTLEHMPHSSEDLQLSLEALALKFQVEWNFARPYTSFRGQLFQQDFRITLIHKSISPQDHSRLFLRKLAPQLFSLDSFLLSPHLLQTLQFFIQQKKNLIICGSTSSGKTALINSLLSVCSPQEHIVILEDTFELWGGNNFVTHLLAKEGEKGKTLTEFCHYALRMRPDRIILGEIRSQEIVPYLLAMNTGHRGLISSLHADSCREALKRMSLLLTFYSPNKTFTFDLAMQLICQNIDYVIYLNERKVQEIVQVLGCDGEKAMIELIYQAFPQEQNFGNKF